MTIPINYMVCPTGLAESHSLESTKFPISLPANWLSERKPLPAVTCSDNTIPLVHQARLTSPLVHNIGTHGHCVSDMTTGFLLAHHRKEDATNRSAYFTEWASLPSFTGQYI